MIPTTSILKRTIEHLAAAMIFAMPLNAAITYSAATITSSPLMITLITSGLATVVSFVRTYFVLAQQDNREIRAASEA